MKVQEDNQRIVLKGNWLMFKPTVKDDQGFYKCIARNEVGVNESAVGLYTVFGKFIKYLLMLVFVIHEEALT